MKARAVILFLVLALVWPSSSVLADDIFSDGFEAATLGPAWSVSGTFQGRATVAADNGPATGARHLVLDDKVSDTVASAAEVTLTLDLSNKKTVVLSFKAKSLGNEAQVPPSGNFSGARNYDGVAVSVDGGTTWRAVASLAAVGGTWESFNVSLDAAVAGLGGGFGSNFKIRFSEFDNAPAPIDGIAVDDVWVTAKEDQRVGLELPSTAIEGSGPHIGYVLLGFAQSGDMSVGLTGLPDGQLLLPASVLIPAGQTFVSFEFSVADDALVNLRRTVTATPVAPAAVSVSAATVVIIDDETTPIATLSLPLQLTEGTLPTANATLSLNVPAAVAITFSLEATPFNEVSVPSSVTVPAGQTQVVFTIQAFNDTRLDGNLSVGVVATPSVALRAATAQTTTIDNEIPALALSLPASLTEKSSAQATVSISGPLPVGLTVNLSSAAPATLSVPATLIIAAGQTSATFAVTAADDVLINFSRSVVLSASGTGVTATSGIVSVFDDETPPLATLSLPAQLLEGAAPVSNAILSLNVAAAVPITFSLAANPASEVTMSGSVTVPAGQTQAAFTIQALNDTKLDGNLPVVVTASAPLIASVTAQTTTIDNEVPALTLTLPATLGEANSASATVTLSAPLPGALTVNLSSSAPATLSVPATLIIAAGQTSATFLLNAPDDAVINLTRSVTVTAFGTGVTSSSGSLLVLDNEALPIATLAVPAQLTEGTSPAANATLSLNVPAAVAISFTLAATPSNEVNLPLSVSVPAGQTQVVFTIQAINDSRIDGNQLIALSASAAVLATASAQTTTVDNEARTLSITLPASLQEGAAGTGTVSIPGTLTAALDVALSNSNASALSVPAVVTIAAGLTSATFPLTSVDNALRDGTRPVALGATAATFSPGAGTLIIRDNEAASYRFSSLTEIVNAAAPLSVTVAAADMEGNVIAGFAGTVNLSVLLPDGTSQPLSPATVLISGATGWTGSVTLPAVTSAPLRLRASDANGLTGDSSAFDLMRVLNLSAADLLWDAGRSRVYASVPAAATGAYSNAVVAIDPATLQITGSVTTGQDPGQMVLTSGGEFLYVVLNANGTIARINPATMSVLSTFAVGTDPSYGTLYASDICTVTGQPNVVVVSQYNKNVSPSHNGVAAYDNGVKRSLKTQGHTGSNIIEPSSDPSIFFGYNTGSTEFGFRRLQLSASGMTQLEVNTTLVSGFYIDLRSEGNTVYSTSGVAVDGGAMKRLGVFPANGLVRPDSAAGRVYFLELQSEYSSNYDKISAYDPGSFSLIRRMTLPAAYASPGSFIRWGSSGLAFRSGASVMFIGGSQLVPSGAPVDLAVSVEATPNPAAINAPLTYSVKVTNQGPNVARNVRLAASLSDSQTLQGVTASAGTAVVTGLNVSLPLSEIAAGATVTLSLSATPLSAGSLTCTASATSDAVDPNFANNTGFRLVSVGFQAALDSVNVLRLAANSLLYDPTRKVLWASIPGTVEAPLGRSLVSINPSTGLISEPIALGANPMAGSIALSSNGRYLYVGLSDVAELSRVDLSASPPAIVRVPLGLNGWGSAGYGVDIEVLDGDGTSVLVTTSGDESALVIDGTVRRADRTGIYTVNRIERTVTPGVFVGYDNAISSYPLSRLTVSASGVAITQTAGGVVTGFSTDIRAAGSVLLSSGGQLVDSTTLTLKANLGVIGRPCVDEPYQRVFLVNGDGLRGFDTNTGAALSTLSIPTTATGDWALNCVRWGLDGFAILGKDAKIYIARWSALIPAGLDANNDGIADAWSASFLNTLSVNTTADTDGDGIADGLEYLFGSSPVQASAIPLRMTAAVPFGSTTILHVRYARRAGLGEGSYIYEVNQDLTGWYPASGVTEIVLSSQVVDGVTIETVEASVPCAGSTSGFVRLKWNHP